MVATLTRFDGTANSCGKLGLPQTTTFPSERMARDSKAPAAIATTLLRFEGTGKLLVRPHWMTVPLARKATLCEPPAATATIFVAEAGTLVWPLLLLPQEMTVPSARRART